MRLEKRLKPLETLSIGDVPLNCLKEYVVARYAGLSVGIGQDEEIGWFVLATAGQGPALVWKEK